MALNQFSFQFFLGVLRGHSLMFFQCGNVNQDFNGDNAFFGAVVVLAYFLYSRWTTAYAAVGAGIAQCMGDDKIRNLDYVARTMISRLEKGYWFESAG